jgi:hypothetical protein
MENSLTVSVILRRIGQVKAEVVGTGANLRAAKTNAKKAYKASGLPTTGHAIVAIILANGVEVQRGYGYRLQTALALRLTTKEIRSGDVSPGFSSLDI